MNPRFANGTDPNETNKFPDLTLFPQVQFVETV
jgi:hypothetical protein